MKYWYLLLAFFILNCAGVKIEKVTPKNQDKEGLRFYRPHPYLLVSEDKDGVLTSELVMLPNTNEEYIIRSITGIGKVELKAKLDQGWNLLEIGEVSDSRASEFTRSITGLLGEIKDFKFEKLQTPITPGLYLIEFRDGLVSGLKKIPVKD